MRLKTFPTLYKRKGKNKVLMWDISVHPNSRYDINDPVNGYLIVTSYGERDGKIQTTEDLITEGKNIGKANETSPLDQAYSEAESKWNAKKDREGYVPNIEDIDRDLRPGVEPMLAHRYDKYPEKINFPCYIQPKLDGHRCLAVVKDGKCTLFSRKRAEITGLPHINEAVAQAFGHLGQEIVLDGELYNHAYHDKFEELTGYIRSQEPKEGCEVVQYHIYDTVLPDATFEGRINILQAAFTNRVMPDYLRLVETDLVEQDQVVPFFKQFLTFGFEGAILRNKDGMYVGKRSYDLQKVKEFEDREFWITGIKEGRGKLAGHAIFTCVSGNEFFDVKMKGETSKLKEIFENQDQYIGKLLTVQFQGMTKNLIPRFPVGIRVRDL